MYKALLILISILYFESCLGQISCQFIPYSYQYDLNAFEDFKTMPALNINLLKSEDSRNRLYGLKQRRFAKDFTTDLHPYNSGKWESLPNGGRVWRLGIRSVNAYSLYLVFGKFHLEKGVTLFVYDKDYKHISNPITYEKNNQNNILPIAPIPGQELIIELDLDSGIEQFGDLTLTKIWHDYIDEFGQSRKKAGNSINSGLCEVDINCPIGMPWHIEKQAVCKLIADGQMCTGTMINNVRGEKIPYLITAYHCVPDSLDEASAIFYFDYEKPFCNSELDPDFRTIEGSTRCASTPNQLDFALLKLNGFPPISYRAFLAGWELNKNNNEYIVGSTCIHHPSGDVKKISWSTDTLTTGSFGEGFNDYAHWVVKRWQQGATEGGSSGAPLFNNKHRLIGTLTGGDARCDNPVNDFFAKLAVDWDFYPENGKQLKKWLDPDNTGATYLNGVDPYGFNDENCDTITNIKKTETEVLSTVSKIGGFVSGHNAQKWTQFAEKFYSKDTAQIAEVIFDVAKASGVDYLSYIMFNIWNGDSIPDSIIYSKPAYIKNINPDATNYFRLDSVLLIKGNFFIGYTINYKLLLSDTFALYHAPQRAINDTSTLYIYKSNKWYNTKDVDNVNYNTSLAISYIGSKNLDLKLKTRQITKESIKLYPNPCNTALTAELQKPLNGITIQCYDISGRSIPLNYNFNENKILFDVSPLKPGIYWLTILTKTEKYTSKFIVIR